MATDPTTEQLLADLAATATAGFYADAYYFDWTGKASDGDPADNVLMEVGTESGEAVQFEMTRDAVTSLQQRLTLWLLATKR